MPDIISLDRLREVLSYCPETGRFVWKVRIGRSRIGEVAGCPDRYGHIRIKIDGRYYAAHRLALFYVDGEWPDGGLDVDHINGDRSDNRYANLRIAHRWQNLANAKLRKNNLSGFKGVAFHRQSGMWRARIQARGKQMSLGLFRSPKEAHAAYCRAAEEIFGEFARAA